MEHVSRGYEMAHFREQDRRHREEERKARDPDERTVATPTQGEPDAQAHEGRNAPDSRSREQAVEDIGQEIGVELGWPVDPPGFMHRTKMFSAATVAYLVPSVSRRMSVGQSCVPPV